MTQENKKADQKTDTKTDVKDQPKTSTPVVNNTVNQSPPSTLTNEEKSHLTDTSTSPKHLGSAAEEAQKENAKNSLEGAEKNKMDLNKIPGQQQPIRGDANAVGMDERQDTVFVEEGDGIVSEQPLHDKGSLKSQEQIDESELVTRTYFVYDRDTVVECEVLGNGSNGQAGSVNLLADVGGHQQVFENVRQGNSRDVGSWFEKLVENQDVNKIEAEEVDEIKIGSE